MFISVNCLNNSRPLSLILSYFIRKRSWFNGRMHASHACDPGPMPGGRISFCFFLTFQFGVKCYGMVLKSMVVCPLLMHKPFPPHSCFAIPFHHSTHQPPLLFSFSLFPFHSLFTTLLPCHHSTLFHAVHVLIVIERNHS